VPTGAITGFVVLMAAVSAGAIAAAPVVVNRVSSAASLREP
jgi:hypothetical protein